MDKYWKVVCYYGHVGSRNEVSVPRFLKTPSYFNSMDVIDLVSTMPGVKKGKGPLSAVRAIEPISEAAYLSGKETEHENLYLKKLMTFNLYKTKTKETA
ncbi:hypothetical protein [Fictibacillus barbaricus]|uniref:Uncharacterized protein n=1 Tax=Fictibacillus barbaricus TaxID=182136 RepID=A0ABU1U3Y6_9BACL|nr:hypothetical protein [Fictibacillus barbaricus]MDR7074163.1 hypothetical protein [Fictibacillus barbaricus]